MIWHVALGSAVGGVARWALGAAVQRSVAPGGFPVGTLAVNLLGSFAIGVLLHWTADRSVASPETRALLTTGFCGGFTTFSAFSAETVELAAGGAWGRAAVYVALSVTLALAATAAGLALARGLN
jgi:CrcB protein